MRQRGHLFHDSWYSAWQNVLRQAMQDVERLDRNLFSNPALAGHLQAIAAKYSFEIAQLNKQGIHANRYESERQGRDQWGDYRTFKQTWLDVTIPFHGMAESFKLAPSACRVPSHGATVGANTLTITLPDDERVQDEVDAFVSLVNQNLDTLRAEYDRAKPQLEQAIQAAADRRRSQINAERQRDKQLSFPVRG